MKRNIVYFAQEKRASQIGRTLGNAETTPIYVKDRYAYIKANNDYDKLSPRNKARVNRRVEAMINAYHRPQFFANGQWWSQADMDAEMMNY